MKLHSSPTHAVEVPLITMCSRFFIKLMITPYTGPRAKAPSRAGRSEKSILTKGWDEHRERELDEHQDKGHCAEHGGNGQVVGRIFSHNFPPGAGGPIQIKTGKPFSRSPEPGRQMKTRPAIAYTITGRAQTNQIVCRFLHPDYTVGPGVSPGQHSLGVVAGCTASGGSHPALKRTFFAEYNGGRVCLVKPFYAFS